MKHLLLYLGLILVIIIAAFFRNMAVKPAQSDPKNKTAEAEIVIEILPLEKPIRSADIEFPVAIDGQRSTWQQLNDYLKERSQSAAFSPKPGTKDSTLFCGIPVNIKAHPDTPIIQVQYIFVCLQDSFMWNVEVTLIDENGKETAEPFNKWFSESQVRVIEKLYMERKLQAIMLFVEDEKLNIYVNKQKVVDFTEMREQLLFGLLKLEISDTRHLSLDCFPDLPFKYFFSCLKVVNKEDVDFIVFAPIRQSLSDWPEPIEKINKKLMRASEKQ